MTIYRRALRYLRNRCTSFHILSIIILGCSIRYVVVEERSHSILFSTSNPSNHKESVRAISIDKFHLEPQLDVFEMAFNLTSEADNEFSKPLLLHSRWHEILPHQRFQRNKTMWFRKFDAAQLEVLREYGKVIVTLRHLWCLSWYLSMLAFNIRTHTHTFYHTKQLEHEVCFWTHFRTLWLHHNEFDFIVPRNWIQWKSLFLGIRNSRPRNSGFRETVSFLQFPRSVLFCWFDPFAYFSIILYYSCALQGIQVVQPHVLSFRTITFLHL